MKKVPAIVLTLAIGSLLCACGSSSSGREDNPGDPSFDQLDPDAQAITSRTQYFGQNGNLWKPVSDDNSSSAGLLVVLLGPEFTGQFDGCELKRSDGTTEHLDCNDRVPWSHEPYSCVANGGREHWRSTISCSRAAEVKVVCRNFQEEVTFQAPDGQLGSVCSRFG